MKTQEFIKLVNETKSTSQLELQYKLHIPEGECMPECIEIGYETSYDDFARYSMDVYNCDDGFVGVWGIADSYGCDPEDLDALVEAFEVEKVEVVCTKYIRKDNNE